MTLLNSIARSTVLVLVAASGQALAGPPLSATDQVDQAIARVEALNPKIRAVIALDPTARAQAQALDKTQKRLGALGGLPILVKDNIETKGPLPTTAGSLALRQNVTGRDAPLVARLRAAGGVILGKTNLSEWANIRSDSSISGWSAVGGQTRNPFALTRNPCGSSSGSGAAVGAGMVLAAIGTETDGSITCPAAINGIVGLKPSLGLVSRTHIVPISHSQDTAGPMAQDVRTAALVLTAIAGSDPADPATKEADQRKMDYTSLLRTDALKGAKIGVLRWATGWHTGVDARFEAALTVLRQQGAILVDITSAPDRRQISINENKVLMTELKANLNAYLSTAAPAVQTRTLADIITFNRAHAAQEMALFGQETFEKAEATKGIDDPDYLKARETSQRLAGPEGIDRMLAESGTVALIAPTAPPAWFIDPVNADQAPFGGAGSLAAVAGYPHLTVPMGGVMGLPVGLSFIGPKWSEARLLALGYAFGQAAPEMKLRPSFQQSIEAQPEVDRLFQPAP